METLNCNNLSFNLKLDRENFMKAKEGDRNLKYFAEWTKKDG